MSKESKPRKPRSTKSNTAELEAKIAELEAKLANLSSQVKPSEARPAQTSAPPPPPKPQPRPAASGPTHGTLPAGMKPAPKPEPKPEPKPQPQTYTVPEPGEVAPAYAATSSAGYTGNKYYATRARLAYHPPNKQFKGSTVSTTSASPPAPKPEPEPAPQTSRGTLPAGTKPPEKKSLWKAKGAEVAEQYTPQEEHRAPPPPPKPQPRPAASGPTHGTLPAGMKPAPKPEPKPEPKPQPQTYTVPEPGEVAPAYAATSSAGYTGNKYYATRRRLAYHPPNKQFTGSASTTTTAPPPAPPPPKKSRGTLPAGFKP